MYRRLSFLSIGVLAVFFCTTAFAEHRDPAPIPSDVMQKLFKSFNIGQRPDRLPDTLSHSLDEAVTLLKQMEEAKDATAPSSAQKMLLESKINEIRGLRDEFRNRMAPLAAPLTLQTETQTEDLAKLHADYKGQLEEHFARILGALGDIQASKNSADYKRALGKARQALYALHEKPREDRLAAGFAPVPTFRQDTPTKVKPSDLETAPAPQYMASQPSPGSNMYAFLGDTLLLAAAPNPVPTQAQTCGYTAADLGTSQEVQITPEIQALAQSLSYSPVKIFQYVSNQVAFEPYFGSLKGAMGTLYAMSGNATDQASLLIALLRASNIPARYVYGTIQFDNDPRVLNWIGAKTLLGAAGILGSGQIPGSGNTATNHIEFAHVWVEACVPYGNYRGTGIDQTGFRWIPLDPSFKEYMYQKGIATNVNFDYTGYMAKRINGPDSLPQEYYAKEVETYIKALPVDPTTNSKGFNNTLQDIGYVGTLLPLKADILPASLPYSVKTFNAWDTGYTAETAEVPDSHRYKLQIQTTGFSTPVTLSMPQIVLNRITLSWKGATSTDQTTYDQYINTYGYFWYPPSPCIIGPCPPGAPATLNVVPVIKLDGVDIGAVANAFNTFTPAGNNHTWYENTFLPQNLTLNLTLNGVVRNSASYPGLINTYDLYAIQAYAFQASDRLLTERAARLLNSVRNTVDPNTDRDDTLGEFLHLAGLKYMRYFSDAVKSIGTLDGGSGLSGNHLGITGSHVHLQYAFDLPYALSTPYLKDLMVDMRGGLLRSTDLSTGTSVFKTFQLSAYAGSAYESYLWQENAKMDAVSTVRGFQFASENNLALLTITSLTDFGSCTDSTSKCYMLTHNTNSALNYSSFGYPPAASSCGTSGLSELSQIWCILNSGNTISLPRSHLQYDNWLGIVYMITNNPTTVISMGISGAYAGGFSVGDYMSSWDDPSSSFDAGLGAGYSFTQPSFWTGTLDTPPTINDEVGLGSCYATTFAGDPVNMITGNVYHNEHDINIKGRGGFNIVFDRAYNSRASGDGPLGYGWTHSFNHYLTFEDDNANGVVDAADKDGITSSVMWTDGTGSQKSIQVTGTSAGVAIGSAFTPPKGYFFQTTRNADGTYSIRERNGLTYTFESVAGTVNQKAKLIRIADRNGNTLTLSYGGNNLLSTVTDGLGRTLTFTYDTNNHITDIHDWTGRDYQYVVDVNGNLTTYKNPLAVAGTINPVTYSYYTVADGTNLVHAMKRYTLPRGNGMTFEYYMNGKAFRHYDDLGETNTFTYNDFRRETVSVNERGFERHFFFDANGNPIKIIEENGSIREYTYDPANPFNRLSKRDPMGYVTTYQYDGNGDVTQTTDPSGNTVINSNFIPNSFGQPGKVKDARGNYTLYKYDANGNRLQEIRLKSGYGATVDPTTYAPVASQIASWTITTYDAYGNVLTAQQVRDLTNVIGPTTQYSYNDTVNNVQGLNAVTVTRSGDKNGDGVIASNEYDTANLTYDALGRVTNGIDADWQSVQYVYDNADRVIQRTDALGRIRSHQFDANGNDVGESLSQIVNGVTTLVDSSSMGYDLADRKTVTLDAGGFATSYRYDASGNPIKITNPDNYSLSFDYDAGNHVTRAYDHEGNAVTYALDLDGKPRAVTDPNGNTVQYVYYGPESNGRLKQQIDGAGRTTTYAYDGNGNVVTVTDNLGNVTYTSYDELNRPTRMAYPYNNSSQTNRPVTLYTYDNLGNLLGVATGSTDATGTNPASDSIITQMTYVYDDFGRKLKETDPLGNSWNYAYDINNNLTQVTDAKGQTTQYTWSYGHQLLSKKDANGNLTSYIRNALGQPLVSQTPGVRYDYAYDYAHRLISVIDNRGNKTLSYSYSPGGLLNSMTDSNGNRTDYLYDPVGRLAGIWAPNMDFIGYDYDAGGRLAEKWLPNGVDARYTYNPDNTLAQVVNRLNGGVISQNDYSYDGMGNRTTNTENINGTTTAYRYVYDALNRLTQVWDNTANMQLASYTYGARHNRTSQTVNGVTTNYVYDPTGALLLQQATDVNGNLVMGFVYDANDNLIAKCEGGTVTRTNSACTGTTVTNLAYDALNELTQVAKTGLPTESYLYDDQGRRIQATVGSTTTNYLYNGPDIEAEYSTWTAPAAQYTHGPDMDEPVSRTTATTTQYYHQDGLGSIVAVTDSTGATVGTQRFDAFGNKLASTGAIPQYGYTGREPSNTGLLYYRARYYDPSIGRFIQRDPIGYQGGINLYAYVKNNPTNLVDADGTLAMPWHFGITFVAGMNSGLGVGQSANLAWKTMTVDWGTQGTTPVDTVQHAMAGQFVGQELTTGPQTRSQAISAAQDFISYNKGLGTTEGLASASHAVQDLMTPDHNGSVWQGWQLNIFNGDNFANDMKDLKHWADDIAPSMTTVASAYAATTATIRTAASTPSGGTGSFNIFQPQYGYDESSSSMPSAAFPAWSPSSSTGLQSLSNTTSFGSFGSLSGSLSGGSGSSDLFGGLGSSGSYDPFGGLWNYNYSSGGLA